MSIKVAINGYGRIGRNILRALYEAKRNHEITIVAIHSFTPIYLGELRPWQVGIVFDDDRRVADLLLDGLKGDAKLTVGANEPYSPADEVY